jgi:hypothetical protein
MLPMSIEYIPIITFIKTRSTTVVKYAAEVNRSDDDLSSLDKEPKVFKVRDALEIPISKSTHKPKE